MKNAECRIDSTSRRAGRLIAAIPFFILHSAFFILHSPLCRGEEVRFKQAIVPRILKFPEDHASHAGFQTEWWYFTGNVSDKSGRPFGYELTIFRRALDPRSAAERGRSSAWAATDVYLGHLAVSDIQKKQYLFTESVKRGAAGVSGATDISESAPMKVWIGEWAIIRTSTGWTLNAGAENMALNLELAETIPPVAHGLPGEEGMSRKGAQPGQASYYYSIPRLKTVGTIRVHGETFTISSGWSWMDHEFGSNQLSAGQRGWEWFSIQLDDDRALMLYVLRNKDGSIEARSSGTWVESSGKAEHVRLDDMKLTPGRMWTSPHTGKRYALEWKIELLSQKASLTINAMMDSQEFRSEKGTGLSYYEGAIEVKGSVNGKPVTGEGYLEITGAEGGTGNSGDGGLGGRL